MGKAGRSTRMEIAIKETGLMTEHMEKEYIYGTKEKGMKGSFYMGKNMEMEFFI